MSNFEKTLGYADSGWEHREEPMATVNVLQKLNLPTLQEAEIELNGNNCFDLDDRALRSRNCPNVVVGRPHAGEHIPSDLFDKMTEGGQKGASIIDRGTQIIGQSEKFPSVGFKISRYVVDGNRPPIPETANQKISVAPGEVVWTKGAFEGEQFAMDKPIYQDGQELDEETRQKLIEKYYLTYYNAVMGTLGAVADRRQNPAERVLMIDVHSFPISGNFEQYYGHYGIKDPRELPLFIIGWGNEAKGPARCDEDIREAFADALEKNYQVLPEKDKKLIMGKLKGGLVSRNDILKGVQNVKFYGEREKGFNALQLELNEAAFVEEEPMAGEKTAGEEKMGDWFKFQYNQKGLKIIQQLLEKSILDIDPLLKGEK